MIVSRSSRPRSDRSVRGAKWRTARFGVSTIVLCTAVVSACSRSQDTPNQALRPEVPAPQSDTLLEIARGFWRAAAQRDSVNMRGLAVVDQPVQWALDMEAAQPGYFSSSVDQLRLRYAYHWAASEDAAIVQLEVSWRSCGPPIHEPDRIECLFAFHWIRRVGF
jgi:hypothetical protein